MFPKIQTVCVAWQRIGVGIKSNDAPETPLKSGKYHTCILVLYFFVLDLYKKMQSLFISTIEKGRFTSQVLWRELCQLQERCSNNWIVNVQIWWSSSLSALLKLFFLFFYFFKFYFIFKLYIKLLLKKNICTEQSP